MLYGILLYKFTYSPDCWLPTFTLPTLQIKPVILSRNQEPPPISRLIIAVSVCNGNCSKQATFSQKCLECCTCCSVYSMFFWIRLTYGYFTDWTDLILTRVVVPLVRTTRTHSHACLVSIFVIGLFSSPVGVRHIKGDIAIRERHSPHEIRLSGKIFALSRYRKEVSPSIPWEFSASRVGECWLWKYSCRLS